MQKNQLIAIALGGNAIKSSKEKGTNEEQFHNVNLTTKHLSQLIKAGFKLIITHGNGPQVGNILIQNDAGKDLVSPLPMDVCGAESQGQIGYMIQQTLANHLQKLHIKKSVATVVTQVLVDKKDPAFTHPTKPVGPFYSQSEGEAMKKRGYTVIEDAGRGYRRVVPSPTPKGVVEIESVRTLINNNTIVVASGGGGIPVIQTKNGYAGVEAVIDKDLAGELLATLVKAKTLLILTDVEKVAINYRKPNQQNLDCLTVAQAKRYADEGHFAPGSMGPKVRAAINFIKHGGKKAIITHPFAVLEAIKGKTGTVIVKK